MDTLNITPKLKKITLFFPSCLSINRAREKSTTTANNKIKTNLGEPQAKNKKLAKKIKWFLKREGVK
jgi:hypothetical protein